jgi:LPS-assembly protein
MVDRLAPWVLAAFFLIGLAVSGLARAEQVTIQVQSEGPSYTLQADRITALGDKELYWGRGHVRLTQGTDVITGDDIRFLARDKTAEIRGNVSVTSPDIRIQCQRMVVNLEQRVGKIYEGRIFFAANHYYLSGDEIEKTGPETFFLTTGSATSCDGPDPAWALTGRDITVRNEGYARARDVTFQTRYAPAMYLPWIQVPVKSRRQSGLLIPQVTDSSRDGFTFTQPVYWAFSDSKDATLYLKHMVKRGAEATIEFRFNDWGGRGTFLFSYLDDQDAPSYYFPRPGRSDDLEERYWLRGKADLRTEGGFDVRLDIDYASDPKYIEEFEDSLTGYGASRRQLEREFSRDLADPLNMLRKSTLQAVRPINNMVFSADMEYTQNLKDPDNLDIIQRLPRLGLDYHRRQLRDTPFFLTMGSEYTYFARRTNDESTLTEEGHRLDVHPRLHLPVKLGPYLDFESSVGGRVTAYLPHGMEPDPTQSRDLDLNHRFFSRELYDLKMELSTSVGRVYQLGWDRIPAVKHRIRPEITYSYLPEVDQSDFPYWDSDDRIQPESRIRYGLSNYLVAKRLQPDNRPRTILAANGHWLPETEKRPEYQYQEFFRFGVYRSYDFVEASRALEERSPTRDRDFHRPHSAWETDLELGFQPYFWLLARSGWDTYTESFTDHTISASVADQRGDSLTTTYELHLEPFREIDREYYEYEEIRGVAKLVLNEEWSIEYEKDYSLLTNTEIESVLSVNYTPQCWGLRLEYSEKPDDRSIALYLNLLGLGEMGPWSHRTQERTTTDTTDEVVEEN